MNFKYRYHLKDPAFSLIKKGTKKIEGRLYKNTFKNINSGDTICFFNNVKKDSYLVNVINIKKYNSFRNMLISEGIKNVTPLSKSLEESISIYRNYYSLEDEIKFGVIAIELTL